MKKKFLFPLLIFIPLLLYVFILRPSDADAQVTQPNILFILADDLRKDEMQSLTFTDDGKWLKFNNASVEVPMCCPSRASILSGRYASDVNVKSNSSGQNLDDSRTIATVMKSAGYRTGLAGKYLNYFPFTWGGAYVPPGWDYWRANGSTVKNKEAKGYYSADYLGFAANNFINQTPTDTPFFFYMAFTQPHLPATPAPRHANAPVQLAPWPQNFNEADVSDKSKAIRRLPLASQSTIDRWTKERTQKARSLLSVNENIESVLANLRTKGLLENTIVVFTSDNGYGFGSHRVESKAFPYEELTSMPFYVRMPGKSSQVINQQISFVDLAPTFADFAGTSMPLTRGISLKPLLNDPSASLPREWVFMEGPERSNGWIGVKSERYKYIVYSDGFKELYDLSLDPYEMTSKASDPAYSAPMSEAAAALSALRP